MKKREQEQAVEMRSRGMSYSAIAEALEVSPSSALRWTRDVVLTEEMRELADQASTSTTAAIRRRERFREAGRRRAKSDNSFRLLCALYWGEGRKRFSNSYNEGFSFTNSDPGMIAVVSRWLVSEGFRNRIYLKVNSPKRMPKEELLGYWRDVIGFSVKGCVYYTNPTSSKKRRGNRTPFGTACLEFCDKKLLHEILGGIQEIKSAGIA